MADREIMLAEIETELGPISVWEFSNFLYLFRATYAAALDHLSQPDFALLDVESGYVEDFALALRKLLPGYDYREIVRLASKELPEDLTLLQLSRRNPISIEFSGIPIALAAAVILSGGSFKLGPLSVRLPPLGTGIAALREAFGRKPKRTRGKRKN